MTSLSVVLPAYNEEANIGPMIEDVVRVIGPLVDDYEIVVVDDGSRDQTAARVREKAAEYPQVRLISHEVNRGYGAAVFTGLTRAAKDLIFFTDSDRQFVIEEIKEFLPLILENKADLVAGYRPTRSDPFHRKLFGWGWSALMALLFGYTVRDVDCAFKLFRRQVVEAVADQISSGGATFSIEFLVRAKRAGFRFRELPVSHRPRVAGSQTGARLDVISRAFREMLRLRWRLWFGERTSRQ
ncbi:MAG: glycosyltransferase family 2 protein [Anaerolineae bacterium]|jgi:glycosyltransferase involved in cell wall biosynthesis|nr:glycosyltransferase family 2 protein [Anaerolineae bacterium]MDH7474187.1 glycosyltransferase family 2 protein [Anaerolineae bacterium]